MKSNRSKKSATEVKQDAASTLLSQEMSSNQIMCENISEVVVNEAPPSVDESLTDRMSETTVRTTPFSISKYQESVPSGQEKDTENKTATNSNGQIGNQNPIHFTTKQMPSDAKGKSNIKSTKKSHTAEVNSKPRRSCKGTTKSPKKRISSRSKSTSGSDNEDSTLKKKNTGATSKNPTENRTAKTRAPDVTTQQKSLKLLPLASVPKTKKHAAKESRSLPLRKMKSTKSPKMKQNIAKGKTTLLSKKKPTKSPKMKQNIAKGKTTLVSKKKSTKSPKMKQNIAKGETISLRKKKIKSPGKNQGNTVLSAPDDVPSPPKRMKLEISDASDSISTNPSQPAKEKTSKSQVNETSDGEEDDKKSKKYVSVCKETGAKKRSSTSSKRKVSVQRRKKAKTKRKTSTKRRKDRSLGKGKSKSMTVRQAKRRR